MAFNLLKLAMYPSTAEDLENEAKRCYLAIQVLQDKVDGGFVGVEEVHRLQEEMEAWQQKAKEKRGEKLNLPEGFEVKHTNRALPRNVVFKGKLVAAFAVYNVAPILDVAWEAELRRAMTGDLFDGSWSFRQSEGGRDVYHNGLLFVRGTSAEDACRKAISKMAALRAKENARKIYEEPMDVEDEGLNVLSSKTGVAKKASLSPVRTERNIDGKDYVDCSGLVLSGSIATAFGIVVKDKKVWCPKSRFRELLRVINSMRRDLR